MNFLKRICQSCLALFLWLPLTAFSLQSPFNGVSTEKSLNEQAASKVLMNCSGAYVSPVNPNFEQVIIEQTNRLRAENNLPPLKRVDSLDQAARFHAVDMNNNDYFNHDSYRRENGALIMDCSTWTRLEAYYTGWVALGENIAGGQSIPEDAMNGWMNSPGHRANILNPSVWEMGVGFYQGSGSFGYYWDQTFGRRGGVFPIILNKESAATNSRVVEVYAYGQFSQMRIKNDQSDWSGWQPFATSFVWTLPETPGVHEVTIEMQGADGAVTSSDTIQYIP
jgi:uncharacterized protein YkwD